MQTVHFVEGSFYHIYNRGNNQRDIFFQARNYEFFEEKIQRYISVHCCLIAWCLMPNHFHLLVQANRQSCTTVRDKPIPIHALTEGIRMLLSSYSKAIQKQEKSTGNLFQQKTKSKIVDSYLTNAFHYIHQNPLRAGLTSRLEDWKWSSFRYYFLREGAESLLPLEAARQHLSVNWDRFHDESYAVVPTLIAAQLL